MNMLNRLYRMLIGQSIINLVENLHLQLLNDWIWQPGTAYIHPQCTWRLADGHPYEGIYQGKDFYNWYNNELAGTYTKWTELVDTVIGSEVGGIVVGEYQFQREANGFLYTAPFTHFYRINRGQITSVQFFIGEVKIRPGLSRQTTDMASARYFMSPN